MKIRTYQVGGPFAGYNVTYTPIDLGNSGAAEEAASGSSKKSSKDGNDPSGFAKEIINMVKQDGLDSDVTKFLSQAKSILSTASDPNGEGLTMSDVLRVQKLANQVRINSENYKSAVASLDKEDAWGEVAMNARGQLYALDNDGNVKTVSVSDFTNNKDAYQTILTNQDLLSYRERNTETAYNQGILHDIQSAVGSKSIINYAEGLIKSFGNNSQTGYSEKETKLINDGLQQIRIGTKITKSTDFGRGSNEELVAAIDYLYKAMPATYQNALKVKALGEGTDVQHLLGIMVQANTSTNYSELPDENVTKLTSGSGSGSGSSGTKVTMTLAESYSTGEGAGVPRRYDITPEGAKTHLMASARSVGPVLKSDGKNPYQVGTVQDIMTNAYGIRQVSYNTVAFGDQVINDADRSALVYDQSDMRRINLPYKEVNGQIVPDFSIQEKIDKLSSYLEENASVMTSGAIQEMLNNNIPGAQWDSQSGTIIYPRTHAFLTFGAMISSEYATGIDFDSKYLSNMSKEEGKSWKDKYENTVKYGVANPEKNAQEVVGHNAPRGLFNRHANNDSFYSGNVFIPLNDNTIGTAIYNGQRVPQDSYVDIAERSADREMRLNTRTNF